MLSFSDHIKKDALRNESVALAEQLHQGGINIPNLNDRKIFILPCFVIIDRYQVSNRSIEQIIREFYENSSIESIKYVIEASKNHSAGLIEKYQDILERRAINIEEIYDYLYPKASHAIQLKWLMALIKNNPQRAIKKLESLVYKTEDDKSIVQALLDKALDPNIGGKSELYLAINRMKCAGDNRLLDKFAEQIKSLLMQPDQSKQEIGYNAFNDACTYFSETIKRDIAIKIIEWLRSLQTTDAYQPYSVKSAVLCWDILLKQPKDDYIYFLFYKLVMHKSKIEAVRLAFEMLSIVSPAYKDDTKVYFEDALGTAKNESRGEYKAVIISGLLSLRPQTPTQEAAEFFDRVAKEQK